ncbi:MAG: hypothetical protein B7X41_05435 [Microbacterium sp. 14-71-5]|nr:MAG: hypothetical protein B7X41_05435 [Microbacterium sp. 14-71-5]
MAFEREYAWSLDYDYNVFGADEHVVVTLWRLGRSKRKWRAIDRWRYSTFLTSSGAHRRAERRIRKLRQTYDAVAI